MSQNHVPRSNPCYQAVVSVLEERGIKHTIKYGGRHPLIMFKYAGYHLQKPFASTTVNRNASRVSEREMRRLLATADAASVGNSGCGEGLGRQYRWQRQGRNCPVHGLTRKTGQ